MTRALPGLTWAAVCSILVLVVYLLTVRTEWGQQIADATLTAAAPLRDVLARDGLRILDWISVGSLAVTALVIAAGGVVARRPGHAIAALVVIGGANITTQVLKRVVFERPDLVPIDGQLSANSLPSGHTTVAASVAVALLLVSTPRWRAVAALAGGSFAVAVGVAVLATGWHRAGDAVAAYLVVGAWAGIAVAALHAWARTARTEPDAAGPGVERTQAALATAVLVAWVVVVAVAVAAFRRDLDQVRQRAEFWQGVLWIVGSYLLVAAGTARVLDEVSPAPR